MDALFFFERIKDQHEDKKPFVLYRKPNSKRIEGILQKEAVIYRTIDFEETGFVFTPFLNIEEHVFFPLNKSEKLSIDSTSMTEEMSLNQYVEKQYTLKDQLKHIDLVNKGIDYIKNNKARKIVLSRIEEINKEIEFLTVFKRLVHTYANAFVYCWYHPKVGMWFGATPETLLKVKSNNFYTMSLAGTQAYQSDEKNIIWGDKEKEEQQIVTDTIVLGLKSSVKKLEVSSPMTHRAGSIVHIKTDISGVFQSKKNQLKSVLETLHPTPAVCGLPKLKAKEFILKEEGYNRKFYTGFLGELNMTNTEDIKESNLFVNLRCMEYQEKKLYLYIGGGITKDSIPTDEWTETIKKSEILKKVL